MNKFSVVCAVVGLLAGVAVGYCLKTDTPKAAPEPGAEDVRGGRPAEIADAGEAATVRALRARVADLEKTLRERGDASPSATNATVVQSAPQPPRHDPRQWMENIRKNDPERYTRMTNQFARMRQHRLEWAKRKIDFLDSVDTSNMSAAAKETHAALKEAMALREELIERMGGFARGDETVSAEEREAVVKQMRENEDLLRRLRREERHNLFEATAKALGFEGEDAGEIVQTLKDVVDATDGDFGGRHRGRRGRGR